MAAKTLEQLAAEALDMQGKLDRLQALEKAEAERAADLHARALMVDHARDFAVEVLGDIAAPLVWTATSPTSARTTLEGRQFDVISNFTVEEGGPRGLNLWLALPCPENHSAEELKDANPFSFRYRVNVQSVGAADQHKHRLKILANLGKALEQNARGERPCPICRAAVRCTRCEENQSATGPGGECQPCIDRQAEKAAAAATPGNAPAPGRPTIDELDGVDVTDPEDFHLAAIELAQRAAVAATAYADFPPMSIVPALNGLTLAVLALRARLDGEC